MGKTDEIIKLWKVKSSVDLDRLKSFLDNCRSLEEEVLMENLHKEHDQTFSQFDCLSCGNCCKTTPPIFLKSDIKRIAKYLKIPPKTFIRKYVLEDVDGTLSGIKVPCDFLNSDNTCSIYEVRPKACREYPHTAQTGFNNRPDLNYANVLICPAAYDIIRKVESKLSDL